MSRPAALDTFTLRNGVAMPSVGFGTFQIPDGEPVIEAVTEALAAGYRHLDTAAIYGNERGVGIALRESGLRREEVFLVSKLWNDRQGFDEALKAFDESLARLGTDFLDLYLIHWPQRQSPEAWRALNRLYAEGRVRAIGVSNFLAGHLDTLIPEGTERPHVNQVEFHPRLAQPELRARCDAEGIRLVAWSPLMQGRLDQLTELTPLAKKYGRSPAQIVLRWDLQLGVGVIPKTTNPERMRANRALFDFELEAGDMARLNALDRDERTGLHPDAVFQ